MTLNRIMAVILCQFTKELDFAANYVKPTEARPTVSAIKYSRKSLVFGINMIHQRGLALLS